MRFLPIVDRELRVLARRRETYSARMKTACAAVVAGGGAMIAFNYYGSLGTGFSMFQALTNILFVFCMMGGAQVTFDCLSEEKREGTLGLLFLTDLKGYDIVLGKLVSRSLGVFCSGLVAFPVLVVLVPLGKAQPAEVGRASLALANTLLLSVSAGLLISAISRKQPRARTGSLLLILWLWLGMPQLALWLLRKGFPEFIYLPLQLASPQNTYQWALSPMITGLNSRFWLSLATTHLLAWGFVILASFLLTRTWQDKAFGTAGMTWRDRIKQWCYGKAAVRRAFRLRLLDRNPIFWLMGRDRLKPLWVWVFLSVVLALGIAVALSNPTVLDNPGFAAGLTIFATIILKLWIGSESSRGFAEEKWAGSLEWLFCTPLKGREIVGGQWLALRRQFLWPIVALLGVQSGVYWLGSRTEEFSRADATLWLWASIGYVATFLLDIWALGWSGMWSGLAAKNPRVARSGAALRIVLIPGLVFYLAIVLQALWSAFGTNPRGFSMSMDFNALFWFMMGGANSLIWGLWSRRRLANRMRAAAAERFADEESNPSWWTFLLPNRKAPSQV